MVSTYVLTPDTHYQFAIHLILASIVHCMLGLYHCMLPVAVPVHSTNRIFLLLTYKRIPIIGIYSNYPIFAATNGIFSLSHVLKIPTIGICSNYVSKLDGLDHAYLKGK